MCVFLAAFEGVSLMGFISICYRHSVGGIGLILLIYCALWHFAQKKFFVRRFRGGNAGPQS